MDRSTDLAREAILEVLEYQIKDKKPAIANKTYRRLISAGYRREDALSLIANVLTIEIISLMKNNNRFNELRYAKNLQLLPNLPPEF